MRLCRDFGAKFSQREILETNSLAVLLHSLIRTDEQVRLLLCNGFELFRSVSNVRPIIFQGHIFPIHFFDFKPGNLVKHFFDRNFATNICPKLVVCSIETFCRIGWKYCAAFFCIFTMRPVSWIVVSFPLIELVLAYEVEIIVVSLMKFGRNRNFQSIHKREELVN